MFIIGNFLLALAKVINLVLGAYGWIVIARALISWVIFVSIGSIYTA